MGLEIEWLQFIYKLPWGVVASFHGKLGNRRLGLSRKASPEVTDKKR
jgi:hypothetical protein